VSAPYNQGQRPYGYAPQHVQQAAYAPLAPYPQAPPVPQTQCRFCGNVPAVDVTFRGHRGMIVIMQFLHVRGPFCRDCGLATFRDMSAKTLVQGWWGYASSIITPITLLINLARRGKVANLQPPRPPAQGPSGRPMDPGAPLLTRPAALIGLSIPLFLIVLVVALIAYQAVTTV